MHLLLQQYLRLTNFKNLRNNKADFPKIITTIGEHVYPFEKSLNVDNLFNVSTWKAASIEGSDFVLKVDDVGSCQKMKFLGDCRENPSCFDCPITRNKIKNFAFECMKRVQRNKISKQTSIARNGTRYFR